MAIDYSTIKVKCKNCGKEYPADSFVLDHVYKMVVCPQCVKDRQKKELIRKDAEKQVSHDIAKKPAGWDKEDEMIEKAYEAKLSKREATTNTMVKTPDGKYKYRCPKCKYEFAYNKETNTPSRCPYCNWEIFF
jgi:DNA-directed RNA polymerase subunit RPC12/RpoP